MSDEEAFLRAVCADPADDTVRLAFADFLQETGDATGTAWAELIRGQIGLAHAGGAPDEATAARVRVLNVPRWQAQWLARMGFQARPATTASGFGRVTFGDWVRGFPEGISGSAEELFANWAALERVPFTRLLVRSSTDGAVEDLTTRPELARLRELFLETTVYESLGERAFVALAGCPHLTGLRVLDAHSVVMTDRGAEALIASPHLTSVGGFAARTWVQHRELVAVSPELDRRLNARFARNRRDWK